ncbi:MAG: tetratricopeptide repeat protein, partial [Candidatus Zixiibacteriota bacterium]
GKSLYKSLLAGFEPGNAVMFASVVRSMISCKLEDEAGVIIEELRLRTGHSALMAVERAEILQQKRKYDKAALEYFSVLKDSANIGNAAEKGLEELLGFEESSGPAEKALLSKIAIDSSGRALRVLSTYYLRTGRYDDAYQFAVRQDSATGLGGAGLIQYLRGCIERKLYRQAIRMCEYVITHLKDKPYINEFYFRYAESLEETGQYDRSIKVYDSILTTSPREQDKAEAAYRIGKIQLDRLNNPQRALIFFDSVLNHFIMGFAYNGASLSKPRAFLQMGELNQARQEYRRLAALRHNPEISEELDFNLALLELFENKYDSCTIAFKKLLVDYPKGFYVNDAVQLLFLINQAGDATDLLNAFSGALLFEKMKKPDSTITRFLSIADAQNKVLADIALFRLAEIVLKRGDTTGAVKYVDRMEAEHADSYYLPYGLKTKADILLTRQESAVQAEDIYKRLLENYPNYPFINEVREKLRKLESAPKPS